MNTGFIAHPHGHQLAYEHRTGAHCHCIFLGGFHSSMAGQKAEALAALCHRRGWAFTRLDYRGHGQSEGHFEAGNISGWLSDALCVIEAVETQTLPRLLVGSSMGAWIALLAARQLGSGIRALVTLAAAPDFTREQLAAALPPEAEACFARGQAYYWPNGYADEPDYPITAQLLQDGEQHCLLERPIPVHQPVLLIHGERDQDIPWQQSLRLMQQLDSQQVVFQLLKGADHRLSSPDALQYIEQQLSAWVAQLL